MVLLTFVHKKTEDNKAAGHRNIVARSRCPSFWQN